MKTGDLVKKVINSEIIHQGIIVEVCEEVCTTIDILLSDGVLLVDQRTSYYEVIQDESRG